MKTLILGGGGREHAVAQAILKSEKCKKVFILPGNAGTEKIGENVAGDINDFEHIIRKVQNWTAKPVCPDTEGAQLRTGSIEGGQKKVETHETIVFVDTNKNSTINCIPLSINNINNIKINFIICSSLL